MSILSDEKRYKGLIRALKRRLKEQERVNIWRKKIFDQHRIFKNFLLENGRVTKEELAEFFPKIPK